MHNAKKTNEYYSDYLDHINKEFDDLAQLPGTFLSSLYDLIRKNIYNDKETYSGICNSLKIDGEFSNGIRIRITDSLLRAKINLDRNNLINPIGGEVAMSEKNVNELYAVYLDEEARHLNDKLKEIKINKIKNWEAQAKNKWAIAINNKNTPKPKNVKSETEETDS